MAIADQDKPDKCVDHGFCVKEDYRGNGIGKALIAHIINAFNKKVHVEKIFTTVEPDNVPSLQTMERRDFMAIEEMTPFTGRDSPGLS